jgi:hypothetical protein
MRQIIAPRHGIAGGGVGGSATSFDLVRFCDRITHARLHLVHCCG